MKVLLIGGAGYIGTSLQKILSDAVVVDRQAGTDVRDIIEIGDGYDVVVYLASLRLKESEQNPDEAMEVNYRSAVRLANSTKAHFVFASTCSNYGTSEGYATEDSPLHPTSIYAKTKVMAEKELGTATILRFATAYGVNEKTRHDLILHDFVNSAKKGRIEVYGPEFYRPICHVDDIAQAIKLAVEKQPMGIYNIGSNDQNYTKMQLAEIVQQVIPCEIDIKHGVSDSRNYRVSFDKIKALGFTAKQRPQETIEKFAHS